MKSLTQTLLLFTVIVIEGYVVLSSELLAIRQTIPYVGSGTDTVSIIIAAVLMPLAFGYQSGGRFRPHNMFGVFVTIRRKLILNILISASILFFGLSYVFIKHFFEFLPTIGLNDRILQTTAYCLVFLVIPVYLLGQTVPLISNYFSKENLSKVTGKILFFSTVGSFLGAVFSTIILMSLLGVHHTASLNFVLMAILVILLEKKTLSKSVIYCTAIAAAALYANSDSSMNEFKIRKNNEYNTIIAGETLGGERIMFLNGNRSSMYKDGKKHAYIEFAEKVAIQPILNGTEKRDILIIGAGAFTFGHNDRNENNQYTYVDIDKDLKDVAERYVLYEPIGKNKTFIPKPARGFLNETDKKFDVIYLDAYLGGVSIPEHLVTREFFAHVKEHLQDGGILITNFIASPNFTSKFSRHLDNTFRDVFPHVSRQVVGDYYNLWSDSQTALANIAYVYRHEDNYQIGHIYTDNKNTVFYDKPKKLNQ